MRFITSKADLSAIGWWRKELIRDKSLADVINLIPTKSVESRLTMYYEKVLHCFFMLSHRWKQ
jgi:hypothetical protein